MYDMDTPIKEKRSMIAKLFNFILLRTENWSKTTRRSYVKKLIIMSAELDMINFLEWLIEENHRNKKSIPMIKYALHLYSIGGDLDHWVKKTQRETS